MVKTNLWSKHVLGMGGWGFCGIVEGEWGLEGKRADSSTPYSAKYL